MILMYDVNGLKKTNDSLGHEKGDELIRAVATAIREQDEESRELIIRADKKMYECKQAYYQQEGNNRRA